MNWFRFYAEALNDPKVQKLSPDVFKAWVNLLCLTAALDGHLPATDADIAFALRMDEVEKCTVLLDLLTRLGLLDRSTDGRRVPHNWSERQKPYDNSTDRTRKWRSRNSVETTVTKDGTSPERSVTDAGNVPVTTREEEKREEKKRREKKRTAAPPTPATPEEERWIALLYGLPGFTPDMRPDYDLSKLREWRELYPNLNLTAELSNADTWLAGQKGRIGNLLFVAKWLRKSEEERRQRLPVPIRHPLPRLTIADIKRPS